MTDDHDQDPSEPELELAVLDAEEEHALAEFDSDVESEATTAAARESGPAPRVDHPTQAGDASGFFPGETIEQSRGFLDQLAPSMTPPESTATSGLHDLSSLQPMKTTAADGDSGVMLRPESEAGPAESAEPRSPSGGLISSILGQTAPLIADDGALAALRTLPRRSQPDRHGRGEVQEHQELLLHLAEHSQASVRARLQTAAAELATRAGEHERARTLYEAALQADPSDRVALRRVRREQLKRGLRPQAAALFRAEAELSQNPRERSLSLCAASELDRELSAKAARDADPSSLLAGLVLAQRELSTGHKAEAAATLRDSATRMTDAPARALLLLEAGRTLELTAQASAAGDCYAQASAADPRSLGAWFGTQRVATSAADSNQALVALRALAEVCDDPRLSDELTRQRAQLLLNGKADARAALEALKTAHSERGLRTLARAAEAAADVPEQTRALTAWAQLAMGTGRGLALWELSAMHARNNQSDQALAVLREASAARAPAGLLAIARDALLRTHSDAATIDGLVDPSSDDALRAAAKLARDPERRTQERETLTKLPGHLTGELVADILSFDGAAALGNVSHLEAALARDVTRWPKALRVGPLLAALDLASATPSERQDAHVRALYELVEGQPVVTRYLAARAASPEVCATLWNAEADAASGELAAFAAAMAGRYLEAAGQDATEAYADALDAVRGYPAGAFGLEAAARAQADLAALERVHRELASTTESAHERCTRRVRLGLLSADSDLEGALRWLELAAEDQPSDAVLDELSIRLSMDQSPASLAEHLRNAAAVETSPLFARALKLRAAAACEIAGQWDEAIRLYRVLLAAAPDDKFVDCALLSALRQSGRLAELASELERRVQLTEEPLLWTPLLEDWASAEHARGESGRARMVLETLLERDPEHVPALRSLQRKAMIERDDVRLANLSLRMFEALEQPAERAAELRLGMRFEALLTTDAAATIARAEGHVRELWYVLWLETWAVRSADRTRMYDAFSALSQLMRAPLEKAAYALRAAEVMEGAAPELAASDLGATLLATPEHPLALEQLGRLYKASGQPHTAAENFERAGFLASHGGRSAPLFYAAGVLFQDELGERERALANLSRTAHSDVLFADTFARLRELLADSGRLPEQMALLDLRLSVAIEPPLAAELELERYALARELGDLEIAKRALREAVRHDPGRAFAWQTLAELHLQDGEHREAAEALVQLAHVADSDEGLAEAFYRLGVLYDEDLPDPRRAEIAFMRVVALTPDDPRAAERLVRLFQRQNKHDQALRTLDHLLEMTSSASKREEYVVLRAHTLEAMGDKPQAEQVLDEARRSSPSSMRVLRALTELYERQGDKTALTLHLQRSCHALRAAIELDPSELDHWLGLCELLRARERPDGAQLVGNMARALGHAHGELSDEPVPGIGRDALRDAVQRRLALRGALDPLRVLLRDQGSVLARCLPFDGPAHPSSIDHAEAVVQAVAQLFGLPALSVVGSNQAQCVPFADEPLTICVGRSLFVQASDAERFFMLVRAVSVAKLGCTLLVRAVPERVWLVLHALWAVADPAHTAAVLDAEEQARVTRELGTAILPAARPKLRSVVAELMGHDDVNPRRLAASAFDFGSRVALMATGNVGAALSALLRLRGKTPEELELQDKLELCRTDTSIRALLSFAISEVYLEARREAAPAAQEIV